MAKDGNNTNHDHHNIYKRDELSGWVEREDEAHRWDNDIAIKKRIH